MSTESIGSLLIDLRANVAQLRTDMDEVKNTIAKSSREMSSQMKHDMQETRQVLALMRDDFGVGVPRELRKVIASSELARTAILGIKNALFGLAFINLGLEAFNKISEYLAESKKHAEEEAKHTREIVEAAEKAVDATIHRKEQLELIGKGEEERATLQRKFFDEELQRNKARLAGLQAEIAAKVALINLDIARTGHPTATGSAGSVGGGGDTPEQIEAARDRVRIDGLQKIAKLVQDLRPQIEAAQKAIDEALAGSKTNELQLADFERNLGISRLKNAEVLALKDVELRQDTIQKMYQASQVGLEQELMALRSAATEKYNIQHQTLQDTLALLEQDPSRNKEKIEQIQTQDAILWKNYEKELTDIKAHGVMERKKLIDEERAMNAAAAQALHEINKSEILPNLFGGGQGTAPKLGGSKSDFMGAQLERFSSSLKDAASQGKFLEQAMEGLLTPTDKFHLLQMEIAPLMEKYKDYPDVIKALTREVQLADPAFQKLRDGSAEFGRDLANEFDQLILKGESFHDFLKNIIADLAEIILKATLLKPLEDFFSGGSTGTGGFLGILGSIFGFRASGGPVDSGQPYIVGERGPELFMPSRSGTIVPNGAMGGVTQIFQIDARGAAPGAEVAIMRGIKRALEQNVNRSVAASIDYQRRR
jgi:hypothetical protein